MGASTAALSRRMFDEQKRYVLTVLQEGVPLVDADYNDQTLSFFTQLRRLISNSIGDGARGAAFKVEENPSALANDFKLRGGVVEDEGPEELFVKGHQAQLPADETFMAGVETAPVSTAIVANQLFDSAANFIPGELVGKTLVPNLGNPTQQFPITANTATSITVTGTIAGVAAAGDRYRIKMTTPGAARNDLVLLDVYVDEIDSVEDPNLKHTIDSIQVEAMQRGKLVQRVFVKEGITLPVVLPSGFVDADGNRHVQLPLALIARQAGNANVTNAMITDLRRKIFRLDEVEDRFVNTSGDTMTGPLVFDPGVMIQGICVVDGDAICDEAVRAKHFKRDDHLLGDGDVVPTEEQVIDPNDPDHFKVHDNRYFCFSEDTEILTAAGWRRHDQIEAGTEIWSFDMTTEKLIRNRIEKVVRYTDFDEMWHFDSARADFLLTQEHSVVYRWNRGSVHGKEWKKAPVQEIPEKGEVHIPVAGSPDPRLFTREESLYWELYGWFVGDGWLERDGDRVVGIRMAQSEQYDVERIEALLDALKVPYQKSLYQPKGSPFRIPNHKGGYVEGVTKRDTYLFRIGVEWATRLNLRKDLKDVLAHPEAVDFEALLRGLVDSDGWQENPEYAKFYNADEGVIDDLQNLCARNGYHTIKKVHAPRMWRLCISKTNYTTSLKRHWSKVPYAGVAWCVTVPAGTVVVRRNGYVAVFGNTKSEVDGLLGANLLSNGNFADGFDGWENASPSPLSGSPAAEAARVNVSLGLCGTSCGTRCGCRTLQVCVPVDNRSCFVCVLRQEACGGLQCGGDFLFFTTLCVTRGEDCVRPFFTIDLFSSCQYVGTKKIMLADPEEYPCGIRKTDGFVRLEKRVSIAKCADMAIVTLCYEIVPAVQLPEPEPAIVCDTCREDHGLDGTGRAVHFCVETPPQGQGFGICRWFSPAVNVGAEIRALVKSNRPQTLRTWLVDSAGKRAFADTVLVGNGMVETVSLVPTSMTQPDGAVNFAQIARWCQFWLAPQAGDRNASDKWLIQNGAVTAENWEDVSSLIAAGQATCGYGPEPGTEPVEPPTVVVEEIPAPVVSCGVGPEPLEFVVCAAQMRRLTGLEGMGDPGIGCKTNRIPIINRVFPDGRVEITPAHNQVSTIVEILEGPPGCAE